MSEAETPGSDATEHVLVAGIYLADRENNIVAISRELSQSKRWIVDQQWIALGRGAIPDGLAPITVSAVESPTPKFALLNQLLGKLDLDRYAFVLVCDDDIGLPPGFVDRYLELVVAHRFALAQAARSHGSDIGHFFVEELDGLSARWTRFVEIGPVFSMRRDAARLLLPFDEASPMGWGYDFIWPVIIERAGLRMGIVDAVPVDHNLREHGAAYDYDGARKTMAEFLATRPHLSRHEAFSIIESYS
jgi:hypothetical protein